MPKLSIIIVNYNVQYFLEQCLLALYNALSDISAEIIVIDNHSSDRSTTLVKEKFPDVILIENLNNVGFSAANNQGLKLAKGEYILLLNPDTILSENSLKVCIQYLETQQSYGAVCIKMLDGSGNYLPESKRGKPTFWASLTKTSGIYKLFPKSKWLNKYYLGHIDPNESADIQVMTGAFMMIRASVIGQIGWLDEDFFMYGEDIDYSYRITQAGYKIRYLPEVNMIHFKGESTKKATFNYLKTFHNAMILFVQKHYKTNGMFYILFLQIAVYFRAFAAFLSRVLNQVIPLCFDTCFIYLIMIYVSKYWGWLRYGSLDYFSIQFFKTNLPLYTFIWVLFAWLAGQYAFKTNLKNIISNVFVATVTILAIYGLLDESLRSSRVIILLGGLVSILVMCFSKMLFNFFQNGLFSLQTDRSIRYAIVAGDQEVHRIIDLLSHTGKTMFFVGNIFDQGTPSLGNINDTDQIIKAYDLDEIIFSQQDVTASTMMSCMHLAPKGINFRMAPQNAHSIISSKSKNNPGELFTLDISFNIQNPILARQKRIFDFIVASIYLFLFPIFYMIQKQKKGYFSSLWHVMQGKASMIGYDPSVDLESLPKLLPGLIFCSQNINRNLEEISHTNFYYAKYYSISNDLKILYLKFNCVNESYT